MKETLWVVGVVGAMVLVGLARAVPFMDLIGVGQTAMYLGAGLGVPLEAAYFTALGLSLRNTRRTPIGWFWRPFAHHHLLTPTQRWAVLPFYYLGALSFVLATLGIAIVIVAIAVVSVDA